MAITITEQPADYTLADGKVFYLLSTNNQFTNAGVAHVFDITFSAIPSNNANMAFNWGGGDVVLNFIFKTTPDTSGLQLPLSSGTIQFFVDNTLIPALERNAILYQNFSLASITNGVRFTARQKGTYYITNTVNFTSGITRTNVASGVNVEERPNFSISAIADILHNGNNYQYNLTAYPYNTSVYLHLNKLLTGFYNRLARPNYPLSAIADKSAAIISSRVRFAETFGAPAVQQQLTTASYKVVLPGGASKEQRALGSLQSMITNKYFLTHQRGMRLTIAAKQVLNYLHTSTETNFNVRFEATKTDGSTVGAVPIIKTSVAKNSLWCIDVSPATVAAALSIDVADIASYNVVVNDISAPGQYFSEFYPVTIEHTTARDRQDVLYQNSLGVYEFAELRGFITKNTRSNHEIANLQIDDPAIDENTNYTLNASVEDSYNIATGFSTRTEAEAFRDLCRSRDIYLVANGYYQPVRLNAKEVVLWDTDSGTLNGFELTFTQEQPEEYL